MASLRFQDRLQDRLWTYLIYVERFRIHLAFMLGGLLEEFLFYPRSLPEPFAVIRTPGGPLGFPALSTTL
eukprot:10598285-Karenia_brevis.AAC.1